MDQSLRAIGQIQTQVYVVPFLTSWVVAYEKEDGYTGPLRELQGFSARNSIRKQLHDLRIHWHFI